jgi:hypothetical protein
MWLDPESWFWDRERRRHLIVLGDHHQVQIIARRGLDWTWRIKRLSGFGAGVTTVGGFGFQLARDARREVLAEFWSDLWTGGAEHEQWRNGNGQRWRQSLGRAEPCRPALVADRLQWVSAVEDEKLAASG